MYHIPQYSYTPIFTNAQKTCGEEQTRVLGKSACCQAWCYHPKLLRDLTCGSHTKDASSHQCYSQVHSTMNILSQSSGENESMQERVYCT